MVLKIMFFVMIFAPILNSCKMYAKMAMQRTEYTGNEFKIGGYYYGKLVYFEGDEKKDDFVSVLLFYRNGFFVSRGIGTMNLNKIDSILLAKRGPITFLEGSGRFRVKDDVITIEFWTNASHFPVPTAVDQAIILNDSTLQSTILGHYENDKWHFRSLSPKPDSTTIFDYQLENGIRIKRGKQQKLFGIL